MYDQETKQKFLEQVEIYATVGAACQAIGIARQTYYNWCNTDPQFKKDAEKALRRGEQKVNDVAENALINMIIDKDFRAIALWLSKRHPKFKTMKEQREIERDFKDRHNKFRFKPLGEEDIEE